MKTVGRRPAWARLGGVVVLLAAAVVLLVVFPSGAVRGAAGDITTVAGTGSEGFSGDGGPATSAQLAGPIGVAVDGAGNLYIAEAGNNRIRKVDTNGTITTVAGIGVPGFSGDGGPATSAALDFPIGVALDGAGNLYIADSENDRIRKVDTNGNITTVAGTGARGFSGDGGPATNAQFNDPEGVALDRAGNLFIADSRNHRIRKVDTGGPTYFGTVGLIALALGVLLVGFGAARLRARTKDAH